MSWDIAILGVVRSGGREAEPGGTDWPWTARELDWPGTAKELEQLLRDDACLSQILRTGRFGEFTRAYQRVTAAEHAGAADDIRESLWTDLQDFLTAAGRAG